MSFRAGNQGKEMWPECLKLGVAAITYYPLANIDLAKYPEGEPRELWAELEPTQKSSLRHVAYEMAAGDIIYVKQGPKIIDKGIVTAGYRFDPHPRIVDPNGVAWRHQVAVDWAREFGEIPVLLGGELVTVKLLTEADVLRIERAIVEIGVPETVGGNEDDALLSEECYFRESDQRRKQIIPRHKKLSNEFREWLQARYGVTSGREREQVDVRFSIHKRKVLAELKVCWGVGTRKSIREALGQLLEYNHYPSRNPTDDWLVLLDEEPSQEDIEFIDALRTLRDLPLILGWRARKGFLFHPEWPD
ncbi:MAG: hypothetical protein ABSE99_09035 [Terracidiphilus sp.]